MQGHRIQVGQSQVVVTSGGHEGWLVIAGVSGLQQQSQLLVSIHCVVNLAVH